MCQTRPRERQLFSKDALDQIQTLLDEHGQALAERERLGMDEGTVERVNHEERAVVVREAPGGVKPSWGGFIPQLLGFELCQRIKRVLAARVCELT